MYMYSMWPLISSYKLNLKFSYFIVSLTLSMIFFLSADNLQQKLDNFSAYTDTLMSEKKEMEKQMDRLSGQFHPSVSR